MTKNNIKKTVAQAISTAVALGWVIMQVESAQAATLIVNNLNDSGVGSLRDTISIANNNDVVEFFLGNNPSTIALTSGAIAMPAAGYAYAKNLTINGSGANLLIISSNNHYPVFDINAANVTFSGLAIAGDINAYNSSNLTFTNSTVSGNNFKVDSNLRLINSTISSNNIEINANDVTLTDDSQLVGSNNIEINANDVTLTDHSQLVSSNNIVINANDVTLTDHSQLVSSNNIVINSDKLIVRDYSNIGTPNDIIINRGTVNISTANLGLNNDGQINAGDSNNSGAAGNLIVTASDAITITGSDVLPTRVPEPSAIAPSSNNSGAGGEISITATTIMLNPGAFISKPVPEPSAIAGSILAASLAWLAKRKQAALRKVKV